MIDWDDYKLVLSIARARRIAGAAEDLGVTSSTVFRRLAELETRLGHPLFHRDQGQYTPTEQGIPLIDAAERMEQASAAAMRQITGQGAEVKGSVTIAGSEVLAPFFLARHVGVIAAQHRALEITVLAGNQVLSLANLEADIAIRPARPTDPALFGRKLATIRWAVYGPKDAEERFIGFAGGALPNRTMSAQKQHLPDHAPQVFSNSLILSASLAVQTGSCVLIPMLLGEQWPGLIRRSDPMAHEFGELWIVCHHDMRKAAKVRLVFDALIEAAKTDRALFEG
ncbi:DNA-binding transcriptional LysR family regulator [Rubricella aquisinus]|uniref:DNA-binding transcriptional LysR family regulator n=1 Tax=Rubricella aquisinus TaxID=2028108 RepID=A0A840WQ64_9RHOB|nr:LysR family transcriptional regulator [Rubricella aquisinus]MBB5516831.1 DNA-binding transcriptional LysR family regulator [Rubricella aquisinus]